MKCPILGHLSLFVSTALLSCIGTQAQIPIPVRVGYLPATHDALLFIALEEKLFPKEIDVQPQRYLNSGEILQHLTAGDVDFGIPGVAAPARYVSTGAPLLIIAGAATRSAALVVRGDLANSFPTGKGGKLTDQEIEKVFEALKSRRVGTVLQSTGDSIFRAAIAKRNLSRSIIVQAKSSPSEILTELEAKNLDAGVLWSPHMTRAEHSGMPIVLWMYELMPNHDHVCCRFVCANSFAKTSPHAVEQFLAGILKAYDEYLNGDRNRIMASVNKYLSPSLLDEDLRLELYGDPSHGIQPRTSLSPDLLEAGIHDYLAAMQTAQLLTDEQGKRIDQSISHVYLSAAYKLAFSSLTPAQAERCAKEGFLRCPIQRKP